jgi:DNA repair protein RadC
MDTALSSSDRLASLPIFASPRLITSTRRDPRQFLCNSARRRLLELGPQALSDSELLSILLRTSGRKSSHELAAQLLTAYGSLRGLLIADRHSAGTQGLTEIGYTSLQAALELARRHYQELMASAPVLSAPRIVREFLRMRLRDLPYEVFAILYLDNRHRVICFEELFRGTIDGAHVHPREVVREALAHNAAATILVHNHPSGVSEPSQADELITRRLKEALALVDIRLLDHLIVGDASVASFAERGLL